jgi:hypothetical protein
MEMDLHFRGRGKSVLAITNDNSRMLTDSLDHLRCCLCRLRADRGLSGQGTPLMAIPK